MKKRIVWGAVVLAVGMLGISEGLFAAGPEAVQAGTAASVKGEVKAIASADPSPRFLKSGDPVFMGEKIETGAEGGLQIQLLDGTVFTLGSSSAFTLDEFIYDPATDDGKVKAHMLQGMFRIVTGKVAHKKPENMVVDLPVGSMGFRGTDVIGIINGTRTEIILVGPVGTGRIFVTNVVNGQVMTVDIDQAGYATIVDGPNTAPVAIFQVSPEELAQAIQALGLPPMDVEGYTPPEIPDPTVVDTAVQSEETSRDISPVQS